jgi:hypothetical protein
MHFFLKFFKIFLAGILSIFDQNGYGTVVKRGIDKAEMKTDNSSSNGSKI